MDGLALWLVDHRDGEVRRIAVRQPPFTLNEIRNGDYAEPTMTLDAQLAQSLMDALWDAGLRPTEAKYPQEHVNALRAHLEDMRRLVFEPKSDVKNLRSIP